MASGAVNAVTFGVIGVSSSNTTATIDFSYDGVDTLTIGILNTASNSTDPRITGFAFNAPTIVTGVAAFSASGTQNDGDWGADFDPDGVNTPGSKGSFDVGGITGPSLNGGSPNSGIAVNTTGTFTFKLLGDAGLLASLTESSFLDLVSQGGNNSWPFAVRFQRLDDGNVTSDVAFGGPTPVPLPAAGWMLVLGLGGLIALRKRR